MKKQDTEFIDHLLMNRKTVGELRVSVSSWREREREYIMHNPRIALAKYAVRGALPQRAAKMNKRIRDGEDLKLPFDRLLWCNVSRRFLFFQHFQKF